ncbi:imm11 family protein [Pyxidicoccus sp. 3LG]
MPDYFNLTDDMGFRHRWHLRMPVGESGHPISNPWVFRKGQRVEQQGALRFPVNPDGTALEFTLASSLIPVVHERVVRLFEHLGIQDVQFIPVQVDGHEGPYFILNTLRTVRSIDDARCAEVQCWKPEDERPDKEGQYRVVSGLRIDPTKPGDARIFRPWGWTVALIVSEDLKEAMEDADITGTRFEEV